VHAEELCTQIRQSRLCTQEDSANRKILCAKFGGRLCMQEISANRKVVHAEEQSRLCMQENSANRKVVHAEEHRQLMLAYQICPHNCSAHTVPRQPYAVLAQFSRNLMLAHHLWRCELRNWERYELRS